MAERSSQASYLQQLGDLHRVQRRAFEQLIAADPKRQAVVQRGIDAQPADGADVFSRRSRAASDTRLSVGSSRSSMPGRLLNGLRGPQPE